MATNKALAEEIILKFPDHTSKGLARKLYEDCKEQFISFEAAYSAIRRARGNHGNRNRKLANPKTARPNGKAGWSPKCPPAIEESWVPYRLDPKHKRVLCLSDLHVPFHSPIALESMVGFAKEELNPDAVILNGDIADFYSVSRHDKDPTRVGGLKGEVDALREVLVWLIGAFPRAKFVYKLGNHEERLDHFIWNKAPELLGVASCRMWEIPRLAELKIEWVGDKRPIMVGKLPVLHGHEFSGGISAPVNPARGLFLKTLHTALIGHLHRSSTHPEPDMFGRETTCWSQGCLCGLNPAWLPINKWTWGFAYIEVKADGDFDLSNYRINKEGKVRTV